MSQEKRTQALMFVIVILCVGILGSVIVRYLGANGVSQLIAGQPTDMTVKTERNYTTTWQDNRVHVVSDATTEYYGVNADVQNVMETTTDFTAEIKDSTLLINCVCHATSNDSSAENIFQNRVIFENTEITQDSIKEYADQCAADCIEFGEHQFGLN